MTVPDAAIEAAAEALRRCWEAYHDDERSIWVSDARAAVEAAMPAIREALAQEIEDEADAKPESSPYLRRAGLYSAGLTQAARIVRGGTR